MSSVTHQAINIFENIKHRHARSSYLAQLSDDVHQRGYILSIGAFREEGAIFLQERAVPPCFFCFVLFERKERKERERERKRKRKRKRKSNRKKWAK